MASFESTTATPSTVSELVTPAVEDHNSLQGPVVASIDSGPVQAYAKLEGEDFCYYIRTLQVSLGRKVSNPDNVDIPLGNTKSVSRQHARLFYNFSSHRFELMVFGKNGAFVNEQFVEKGVTVPLENRTKIQIGEMAFVFLLPKKKTNNVNATNNVPQHNMEDLGYISTPHQLEKNATPNSVPSTLHLTEASTAAYDDYELRESSPGDDEQIEALEMDMYQYRNCKPPYSYATLIAQAINSTNEKRMTLSGIYNYITSNYPYYQLTRNGWQNSIRHNLSLNKAFVKVPRSEAEPGKGAFWTIGPDAPPLFSKGVYKRNKKNMSTPTMFSTHHSIARSHQHYSSKSESESARKRSKKEHITKESIYNTYEDDGETSVLIPPVRYEKPLVSKAINHTESDTSKNEATISLPPPAELMHGTWIKREPVDEQTVHTLSVSPLHNRSSISSSSKSKVSVKDIIISDERVDNFNYQQYQPSTETRLASSSKTVINNSSPKDTSLQLKEKPSTSLIAKNSSKSNNTQNNANVQAQLQIQLQNTIRQHLLDPVRYPLPPTIAQLLPQAIAQLPSELATQISSTLHSSLKTENNRKQPVSDPFIEAENSEVTEKQVASEVLDQDKAISPSDP